VHFDGAKMRNESVGERKKVEEKEEKKKRNKMEEQKLWTR